MKRTIHIAMLGLGTAVGLKFADIDQRTPWLEHRSILTHSFLPALLFALWAVTGHPTRIPSIRWSAMGFGLGASVHLCFDLFPRAWWKHALIHVPFYGWLSPLLSWLWISGSAILCCACALGLTRAHRDYFWAFGALIAAYVYAASAEPRIAWPALIALLVTVGLAVLLSQKKDIGPNL